jgi:hypothetical protein
MVGLHGRIAWQDGMAGLHGRIAWQDCMAGWHGKKIIKQKSLQVFASGPTPNAKWFVEVTWFKYKQSSSRVLPKCAAFSREKVLTAGR